MKIRISAKSYLILLLASICTAFCGLLFYFFQNRINEAQYQALDQAHLFALISSRAIDSHHADLLMQAQVLARKPEAAAALAGHSCGAWLAQARQEHGYANLYLFSTKGDLICSALDTAKHTAPGASFAIRASAKEHGLIGSFYADGSTWVYPAAFPVLTSEGAPLGSLTIAESTEQLELLRDSLLDRGAEISYIDTENRVGLARISHSNMRSGEMASPAVAAALKAGIIGRSSTLDDGTFASANKAPLSGWVAFVAIRSDAVYTPLRDEIFHQTLILGVFCIFALFGIWGIANRLSAATSVLVRAAGNVESLFSSRFTGVSEIDNGIAQMRESSREKAKAQAAVELWRTASERTRSGMAILKKTQLPSGEPVLSIELCNPAFESLSGMGDCLGQDILRDAPDMSILGDKPTQQEMHASAVNGEPASRAGQGLDAAGRLRHVLMSLEPIVVEESSARELFCLTLEDVTDIANREAELEKQSTTDALTNLPNRALFTSLLSKSISLSQRNGSLCAVGFFDLDHFKFINDSIGHEMGDKVIAEVARRLAGSLRPGDTLSRFGGDEFGLVLADVDGVEIISSLVEHAREALSSPVIMAGQSFALTPNDGDDPQSLMSAADIAMFQAKETGRGNVKFHSRSMSENFAERLTIEQALKTALAEQSIEFLYQPKISLATGQPCGMEALARWRHPVLGEISPSRFIPLAEESELIATLGDMAIKAAMRDAKILWDEGFRNMPVAINVSARQIKDGFTEKLVAALEDSGLPASSVHVEITESSVMPNSESTRLFLSELHRLGIKVALDDFGTGWSNMAMLKTLPLSYLKMDRSFIVGLGKDEKDAAIAKAIIGLAKALGVEVIAEGVETQMQAQQLHYLQADQLQGYYICKPMAIADVSAWLNGGYVFQGALAGSGPQSIAPLSIHHPGTTS
jgi:diguanylate cyclase (GGDEF)-like protein